MQIASSSERELQAERQVNEASALGEAGRRTAVDADLEQLSASGVAIHAAERTHAPATALNRCSS